jgi:hypothetical protein
MLLFIWICRWLAGRPLEIFAKITPARISFCSYASGADGTWQNRKLANVSKSR